jgi:hypothetical protein
MKYWFLGAVPLMAVLASCHQPAPILSGYQIENAVFYVMNGDPDAAAQSAIQAPARAKVNEPVEVTLHTGGPETCWSVDQAKAIVDDERRTVTFSATLKRPTGIPCGQMPIPITVNVSFTPTRTGKYILQAPGSRREQNRDVDHTWTAELDVVD